MERNILNPRIIEERSFTLVGMSFYGDPFNLHGGWDEENQIGLLWKRFFAFLSQSPDLAFLLAEKHSYEVHIYTPETIAKGLFEVFVGLDLDISRLTEIPAELLIKHLPACQYAVFTFQGEEISADWEKLLSGWMQDSDFESAGAYNFQYYDARFKGLDRLAESMLDVYVPIKKKSA